MWIYPVCWRPSNPSLFSFFTYHTLSTIIGQLAFSAIQTLSWQDCKWEGKKDLKALKGRNFLQNSQKFRRRPLHQEQSDLHSNTEIWLFQPSIDLDPLKAKIRSSPELEIWYEEGDDSRDTSPGSSSSNSSSPKTLQHLRHSINKAQEVLSDVGEALDSLSPSLIRESSRFSVIVYIKLSLIPCKRGKLRSFCRLSSTEINIDHTGWLRDQLL